MTVSLLRRADHRRRFGGGEPSAWVGGDERGASSLFVNSTPKARIIVGKIMLCNRFAVGLCVCLRLDSAHRGAHASSHIQITRR